MIFPLEIEGQDESPFPGSCIWLWTRWTGQISWKELVLIHLKYEDLRNAEMVFGEMPQLEMFVRSVRDGYSSDSGSLHLGIFGFCSNMV